MLQTTVVCDASTTPHTLPDSIYMRTQLLRCVSGCTQSQCVSTLRSSTQARAPCSQPLCDRARHASSRPRRSTAARRECRNDRGKPLERVAVTVPSFRGRSLPSWLDPNDIEAVQAASWAKGGNRFYLGLGDNDRWAWGGPERSILVLGPPRSGKTSSFFIPAALAAVGAVVCTSTKLDFIKQTAAVRSALGWAYLYDPSGKIDPPPGVKRIGWSPVNAAHTWRGAKRMAESMVLASQQTPGRADITDSGFWYGQAATVLAALLHAAALKGSPMETAWTWANEMNIEPAMKILTGEGGNRFAAIQLEKARMPKGTNKTKMKLSIWSTASYTIRAYGTDEVMASTELDGLDLEKFCNGPNTLYICATSQDQELFAPLVVGMLGGIRDAAYQRAANGNGSPPVQLLLDEAANIAPLPDLPKIL
jgi:type IV secretory pathway TraG/TraD family ATPase VirD4